MITVPAGTTRVAVITGGAQGIGRAAALRLAEDGLDVAVADLPSKLELLQGVVKEVEGFGQKALAVTVDVTKEDEVSGMVDKVVETLGRLDVMVANAGVGQDPPVSVVDVDLENWEKIWQVNTRGVVLSYKYAARQMIKQNEGGRIIGASSSAGLRGHDGWGGYCMSKAAVRSLTQTVALELRQHRITVNAYAPGAIDTPMIAAPIDQTEGAGFAIKQAFKISEFRTGQPQDVAAVISFLASEGAHFVTGQTLGVNDGCVLT
ncbi:hypothetical protein HMN09_00008300 [Mycena chlorophos]|uniref:NAD(P)-binding protein n=1 Tax=Mycena chlorophos TaxID=658473 RepID=A0A8H6WLZ5_MYCCL|nr:hypothetical protein HMN09_00008300 [Mycena chlorophos]